MIELEMETAVALMGVLSTSQDEDFKAKMAEACKTMAEYKRGLFAMAGAWYGTDIPADVKEKIATEFGVEFLYERNVLSAGGEWVELNVLCEAMPEDFLENFFHFDIKERAEKEGITVGAIEDFVRETYRGLNADGDYLFEFGNEDDRFKYLFVLGISGMGRSECGKYHRIYADMNTFGVTNIRNILFRKDSNDSGTQEAPKA